MDPMKALPLALPLFCVCLAPAVGWTAPVAPLTPKATSVSPLTVPGGPGPRLVSSFPAEGAKISAGVTTLVLKFDQPMASAASLAAPSAVAPACLARPRPLDDGKTLVFLCTTAPNRTYAIDLAANPALTNTAGRAPGALILRFATDDTIVDDIDDALQAASLTSDDDPVMGWRQAGEAVSDSPTTRATAAASGPTEKGALDSPAVGP